MQYSVNCQNQLLAGKRPSCNSFSALTCCALLLTLPHRHPAPDHWLRHQLSSAAAVKLLHSRRLMPLAALGAGQHRAHSTTQHQQQQQLQCPTSQAAKQPMPLPLSQLSLLLWPALLAATEREHHQLAAKGRTMQPQPCRTRWASLAWLDIQLLEVCCGVKHPLLAMPLHSC